MDLIDKYIGEGNLARWKGFKPSTVVTLQFSTKKSGTYLDEIDALLVRGGVTGNPDFNNISIAIDNKDLKKAEKLLKGTSYRRYTVEK